MIIPKSVAAIANVASTAKGYRDKLHGVKLSRVSDTKCVADCTDGRQLIRATWTENEKVRKCLSDYASTSPVENFSTVIPAKEFENAAKYAPRKLGNFSNVILDEPNANGRVNLISTNGNTPTSISVESHGDNYGEYPDFDKYKVIPDGKSETLRIGLDANLLCNLLKTLAVMSEQTKDNCCITLSLIDKNSPVKIECKGKNGIHLDAVIMPVRI